LIDMQTSRKADHLSSCRLYDHPAKGTGAATTVNSPHPPFYTRHGDIIPRGSPCKPSSSTSPQPARTHGSALSALKSLSFNHPGPSSSLSSPDNANERTPQAIRSFSQTQAADVGRRRTGKLPSAKFSSFHDDAYYRSGPKGGCDKDDDTPSPTRSPGVYSRPKSLEIVSPMIRR
jgi:hypothetical protein